MALAIVLAQGGLGATLIRRVDPPSTYDLGILLAVQSVLGLLIFVAVVAISLPFGTAGYVTAVLVAPLPLLGLRIVGLVVLERAMRYGRIAIIEVAEHSIYAVWAVITAWLGWGVWSLATAGLVRGIAASALMVAFGPVGLVSPRWSLSAAKRLLAFGVRVQGVSVIGLSRDQAINVGTALIAGTPTLGVWTVGMRFLQLPLILYGSLWRVSLPGMSRLRARDVEMTSVLARTAGVTAAGAGVLLAPLVGLAPAYIPLLLGDQWSEVVWIMPAAGAALLIGGPISVALTGYLWASGDAHAPLRASAFAALAWLFVGLPLLSLIGLVGLSIGWLVADLVAARVLIRGAARQLDGRVPVVRPIIAPISAATAAACIGWLLARDHASIVALVAGFFCVEFVYFMLLIVLDRVGAGDLRATVTRLMRAWRPSSESGTGA
jgi:O-antigen/teichoic acid export membrane protein